MPDTVMNETPAFPYRNRSPEIAKLAAALCKAQGVMEGAKKDAEVVITGQTKRTYADLASVWEAVRKPLTDNGLAIVQFPRSAGQGVEIETTLLHVSGEFMCDVLWVPCGKNDAQGLGSAITYGRRYALMAVTGIAPVDDDGAAAGAVDRESIPGVRGGAPHFRPDGPRRFQGNGPTSDWVGDAKRDGIVDETRAKGTLPGKAATPAASAVKRVEWCKNAVEGFKMAQTKDELLGWWKTETERLGVIEEAMPAEYERLLAAYDAAIERTAARVG